MAIAFIQGSSPCLRTSTSQAFPGVSDNSARICAQAMEKLGSQEEIQRVETEQKAAPLYSEDKEGTVVGSSAAEGMGAALGWCGRNLCTERGHLAVVRTTEETRSPQDAAQPSGIREKSPGFFLSLLSPSMAVHWLNPARSKGTWREPGEQDLWGQQGTEPGRVRK